MQQQGGQGQSDHTSNFFWLVALLFGVGIAFWWADSVDIIVPVFWVRIHEIKLIELIVPLWTPIATWLHLPVPDLQKLIAIQHYMQNTPLREVTWKAFAAINTELGDWSRYPVVLILLVIAAYVGMHSTSQFHHEYSMKTLRVVGQEVWPQITPVISLDLIKENIDKGPWAMCKPPLAFCREHNLLSVKMIAAKKVYILKQKPSYRLFALQLGPMWRGIHSLPIHVKALAVIFLARATGQRAIAKKFLSQIAMSAASGKLDFTGVSDHLNTFKDHRILQWLEKRHAYVMTLMATLLEIARSDGVLASAEFLWLKPVDRRMWFMMSNVGRRTAFVEIAGAYSHWVSEKKMGRALKTPMVKGAVEALDETLQNILFVEEGDQWRTTSAD